MTPRSDRPLLYLLPGLDGTGRLYRSLVELLSIDHDIHVMTYSTDRFDGYEALAGEVIGRLSIDRPYVVIAESFAGPLAALVAARRPPGLAGMVIAASFLHEPVRASRLLAGVMDFLPSWMPPPLAIIERVLMGRWKNEQVRLGLAQSLRAVIPSVLKARLKAALLVDAREAFAGLDLPLLVVRATCDDLLQRSANDDFDSAHAEHIELEAPHFVFQAVPEQAAALVSRFLQDRRILG